MEDFNQNGDHFSYYAKHVEKMGWAGEISHELTDVPNNPFYRKLKDYYVSELNQDIPESLQMDVWFCFSWVKNFVPNEMEDMSFYYISQAIVSRFDRKSLQDYSLALKELNISLDKTLSSLILYLQRLIVEIDEELLFAKFLSSYVSLKSNINFQKDHILYRFRVRVLDYVTTQKDLFKEITSFNKISKLEKFRYRNFAIELSKEKQNLSKIDQHNKNPDKFAEFWNVDNVEQIHKVLDSFILNSNKKYLIRTESGYDYILNVDRNKSLAGLIVAFHKTGWISSAFFQLKAPKIKRLLDDFFNIVILDPTPFTPSRLMHLFDETNIAFEKFVKELIVDIPRKNRF